MVTLRLLILQMQLPVAHRLLKMSLIQECYVLHVCLYEFLKAIHSSIFSISHHSTCFDQYGHHQVFEIIV
jgi:hypothetical protein